MPLILSIVIYDEADRFTLVAYTIQKVKKKKYKNIIQNIKWEMQNMTTVRVFDTSEYVLISANKF